MGLFNLVREKINIFEINVTEYIQKSKDPEMSFKILLDEADKKRREFRCTITEMMGRESFLRSQLSAAQSLVNSHARTAEIAAQKNDREAVTEAIKEKRILTVRITELQLDIEATVKAISNMREKDNQIRRTIEEARREKSQLSALNKRLNAERAVLDVQDSLNVLSAIEGAGNAFRMEVAQKEAEIKIRKEESGGNVKDRLEKYKMDAEQLELEAEVDKLMSMSEAEPKAESKAPDAKGV